MSDEVVRLSLPARSDYLLLARLTLSGLARSAPIDDELLADLKLAVTEACGNAVRHAYPDTEGEMLVSFALDGQQLVVTVEDQGVGLDTDGVVEEVSRPLESGMGMSIIRAIVDELDVSPGADGRGTVVRMTTTLRSPETDGAVRPS